MKVEEFNRLKRSDFDNGAILGEIRTALQQREELLEALKPFAEKCPDDPRLSRHQDHPIKIIVRLDHLRQARAAIAAARGGATG